MSAVLCGLEGRDGRTPDTLSTSLVHALTERLCLKQGRWQGPVFEVVLGFHTMCFYICNKRFINKTQMQIAGFCFIIPQSPRKQWGLKPGSRHSTRLAKPRPGGPQCRWKAPPPPQSCCAVPICLQVKSVRRRDKKASVLFIEGNMNPKGRGLVL